MSDSLDWIDGDYFHFKKESSRRIVANEMVNFLLPKIQKLQIKQLLNYLKF